MSRCTRDEISQLIGEDDKRKRKAAAGVARAKAFARHADVKKPAGCRWMLECRVLVDSACR